MLNQLEGYGTVRKNKDKLGSRNNCKPPQILIYEKLSFSLALSLFGLKSFHMGFLFLLDGRMEFITCLFFYLVRKMEVLRFGEKPYQTWQTVVKTLKKIEMFLQEHTNRVKYHYVDF